MQEYAIDQEFEYEGKVLKVVKDGTCAECYFKDTVHEICKATVPRQCAPSQRRTIDQHIVSYLYLRDGELTIKINLTE